MYMQRILLITSVWTYNSILKNFCVIFFEIYWNLFRCIVSDDEISVAVRLSFVQTGWEEKH